MSENDPILELQQYSSGIMLPIHHDQAELFIRLLDETSVTAYGIWPDSLDELLTVAKRHGITVKVNEYKER